MVESPRFGDDFRTGISEPDITIGARGLARETGTIKRM